MTAISSRKLVAVPRYREPVTANYPCVCITHTLRTHCIHTHTANTDQTALRTHYPHITHTDQTALRIHYTHITHTLHTHYTHIKQTLNTHCAHITHTLHTHYLHHTHFLTLNLPNFSTSLFLENCDTFFKNEYFQILSCSMLDTPRAQIYDET